MTFHGLPNGARFKLKTEDEVLKKLVCIKVDHMRFAQLEHGSCEHADEVVRVCYGDFEVIAVTKETT